MARVLYLDASALAKRLLPEREREALEEYVAGARVATSEIALTEVSRAIRRLFKADAATASTTLRRWSVVSDATTMLSIDRAVLEMAGALTPLELKSLDAVHVASALDIYPIDAFVTYDKRQAAAARQIGLTVASPGRQ